MHRYALLCSAVFLASAMNSAQALDYRGNVSAEVTYFPSQSTGLDNWRFNSSFAAEAELSHDFADNVRLTVHPYARWDQQDDERTVVDVRELLLSTTGESWDCLLYTSPSPRDKRQSRMPSSA